MEYFSVEEIMQNERTNIRFITQIIQNDRQEVYVQAEEQEVAVQAEEEVSLQTEVNVPEPKQVVHAEPSSEDEGIIKNGSANGTDANDDSNDIDWDADHLDITKYLMTMIPKSDYRMHLVKVSIEHS
jgi:hypothetical protein